MLKPLPLAACSLAACFILAGSLPAAPPSPAPAPAPPSGYQPVQPQAVTFTRTPSRVGDTARQSIVVDLKLKTTTRAGNKVLEQAEARMLRSHDRVTTATAVGQHGAVAATVAYRTAERSMDGADPKPEAVAGKAYKCLRDGDELRITTLADELPPVDEFRIVSQSMQTLGLPNPLIEFFAGRTVAVGEKIELPKELAAQVLGFDKSMGVARRFTLELLAVEVVEGARCGVFKAEIEAGSGQSGQMRMIVGGRLVMKAAGCRTVSAELSGPIGMSETRRTPQGPVQMTGVGSLKVAIRTHLGGAARR